ncbi:hypothetical protein LAZ67_3005940 [Cordylochernes scorpioides]|uniref:Uncharacterized protein n=1 Tax=Cordylochernes scorpioides TaxID=51811 RepID=A0ABY6KCL3_9ARAC|nr:hypothetical protein LAZ67_3005940 [Cordylochernes scorpioides]
MNHVLDGLNIATPEMVSKFYCIFMEDRQLRPREFHQTGGVQYIFRVKLQMKKTRVRDRCRNCLRSTKTHADRHFPPSIWIHHYTPEYKQQSKLWTGPGERTPKSAKTVVSAVKNDVHCLWDSQGIILTEYCNNGKQ